jgi:hypothetical protein
MDKERKEAETMVRLLWQQCDEDVDTFIHELARVFADTRKTSLRIAKEKDQIIGDLRDKIQWIEEGKFRSNY